jgi:hypothetical protein
MLRHFAPRAHGNALRDPQIPLDATQVPHNMSQRAFYGNYTRSTHAQKIVR